MKRILPAFLVLPIFVVLIPLNYAVASDVSFNRIKVPNADGKRIKSVLTFSDTDHAIEVHPIKGKGITVKIPYVEISKCSYEFTMQTSKTHWLEIHYTHDQIPKTLVLRMDRHNYLRILDAVKTHTGQDAEVLGNAVKRH